MLARVGHCTDIICASAVLCSLCRLQNGTTYNSFLIFGEDKTALVDASHEKFRGLYIDELKAQLKKAGRKIDYIFISHTEPDHSGKHSNLRAIKHDLLMSSKFSLGLGTVGNVKVLYLRPELQAF